MCRVLVQQPVHVCLVHAFLSMAIQRFPSEHAVAVRLGECLPPVCHWFQRSDEFAIDHVLFCVALHYRLGHLRAELSQEHGYFAQTQDHHKSMHDRTKGAFPFGRCQFVE